MNIFEIYREQIVNLLKELSSQNILQLPENLNNINVDIPPLKFDGDISSNVAMILSKLNKKSPNDIANLIINEIKKDQNIESIAVEKPGFINIKFKKTESMKPSYDSVFLIKGLYSAESFSICLPANFLTFRSIFSITKKRY